MVRGIVPFGISQLTEDMDMNLPALSIIVVVAAATLAGGTATAAERALAPAVQGIAGGARTLSGSAATAPLKGNIKLNSSAQLKNAQLARALQIKFEQLNQKFTELTGNATLYEGGVSLLPTIAKTCSTKAYTVQDQKAAGCSGNESLNQCMDKLYKYCVATFSTNGLPMPTFPNLPGGDKPGGIPGYSTKQFKQAAQAAASEARVLSQMLNQYANQADQNAKAFGP